MKLEDIEVGDELQPLEKEITNAQLFRYSAVTWNPHRIHYDTEYAKDVEGHPDVLVHQDMHGAVAQQLLLDWVGTDGELRALSWRNVGRATSGDVLVAEAEVIDIDPADGVVEFHIETHTGQERCAEGTATMQVRSSGEESQ